jgi:hypothetical protein
LSDHAHFFFATLVEVYVIHRPPAFHIHCRTAAVIICLTALIAVSGCSFSSTEVDEVPGTAESIYITDINGARWDISHAIRHYGFNLEGFSTSKGPYARPPIIDPEMISPDEPGYPPEGATARVIATYIGGEGRAYSIDAIIRNEVVVDRVAGTPVTVAY